MSSKKNILVTGANGQLGMEFRQLEKEYPQYQLLFVAKEELSITNNEQVQNYFSKNDIAYCINCAAYTAVDKAEAEHDIAMKNNALGPGHLATMCKKYGAAFFHFSSDYVFNGEANFPYTENAQTAPVNFYGETKLEGEKAVLQNNENAVIIRTSWVYGSHGKNFVKTMLRLMCEKESIGVVNDQFGSPTYAADLAEAVMTMISSNKQAKGIYHYCNEGVISWYDLAIEIKELTNSKCEVNAIPSSSYPVPAARPHYSALDTAKIRGEFSLNIPKWKVSLIKCIDLLIL